MSLQLPPFEFLNAWGDKGDGPGKARYGPPRLPPIRWEIFFADPGSDCAQIQSSGTPLLSFEDSRLHHASGSPS